MSLGATGLPLFYFYFVIMNNFADCLLSALLKIFLYLFNHVGFLSPNSVKKNVVFTGLLFLLSLCLIYHHKVNKNKLGESIKL